MSLEHAKQVMRLELDPLDRAAFAKILSAKQAIMSSVLTATVRVNDGDLRRKSDDGIQKVLDAIKAAEIAALA